MIRYLDYALVKQRLKLLGRCHSRYNEKGKYQGGFIEPPWEVGTYIEPPWEIPTHTARA